jgi:microcystin-dependent protein
VSEPYIAQIQIFGFSFAPINYAYCNGQILPISQNNALFAIIGTTYGGDGVTTYGLPNIQERGVVNIGQAPGLSNYDLGERTGTPNVTLNTAQIPMHNHLMNTTAGSTQDLGPTQGGWFGNNATVGRMFSNNTTYDQQFNQNMISISGGSQPHINEQPYLVMNYCIALYGIFPTQN